MIAQILPAYELQPIHISGVIALAVFVGSLLLAQGLRRRDQMRRRSTSGVSHATSANGLDRAQKRQSERLMERAARLLAPGDKATISLVRRQLVQAGFFSDFALPVLYASRALCACGLPLLFLTGSSLLPFDVPATASTLVAICLAVLGLVLPPVMLDARARSMQQKYRHAFPDFMDLLVVCVELGQSMQSAIARVSEEMMESCPELGFNLHLVSLELRAGSTLNGTLQSLHGRLGIEEVRSLAVLLKQSEELGASIAGTLRVFSDEMREKRLIRAETKANTLPVKMTIPLGLFIFPVIMLVILVPVAIRIKNAFV